MFWGFFNILQKLPSSIKNGLRALFLITITIYGSNIVKNGLVLLSECWLEVEVWTTSWKVEKMDKCVAFPVVSPTCPNTFETNWKPAFNIYLALRGPAALRPWIPREMDSCVCHVDKCVWNEFVNSQKTGRSSCLWKLEHICHTLNYFLILKKWICHSNPPKSKIDLNFSNKLESSS